MVGPDIQNTKGDLRDLVNAESGSEITADNLTPSLEFVFRILTKSANMMWKGKLS